MEKVAGHICSAKDMSTEVYHFQFSKPVEIEAVEITDVIAYQLEETETEILNEMIAFDDRINGSYVIHREDIKVPEEASSVVFTKKNGETHEINLEDVFGKTLERSLNGKNGRVHSFVCEEEYFTYGSFIEYDETTKQLLTTKEEIEPSINIRDVYVVIDEKVQGINSGLYLRELDL